MLAFKAMQWFQNIARRQQQGADPFRLLDETVDQLTRWEAEGKLAPLIQQMLIRVGLDRLLPKKYSQFKSLLLEGMAFVLAQLPRRRLARKLLDQAVLGGSADSGERIRALINDMPTLQKLGQILARDPGLDAEFRHSLTDLEDNIRSVTFEDLQPALTAALSSSNDDEEVIAPEFQLLAEATVCAVMGATVRESEQDSPTAAVLKLIKPAVCQNLALELDILDRLAQFLDDNTERWGLGEFQFRETFQQVRWCLENEVDLSAEQENLSLAGDYFRDQEQLIVPRPLPGGTSRMTVMSREAGHKITDVDHLDFSQRRALAMAVARTLILDPITSLAPESIFHGDPHAGNIAYKLEDGRPRIILYDWGMMGRLEPMERVALVLMALGIAAQSTLGIVFAADLIANGAISADGELNRAVTRDIDGLLAQRENRFSDILSTLETVFERLTYRGVSLPLNLLMFKKAQFTLKGVLSAIDPAFERDQYLIWAAAATFVRDFAHLRYQRMIMAVAWDLHRHSLKRIFKLQKQLLALFRETSLWLLNMPFQLLDGALVQAQLAYVPVESRSRNSP